MAFSLSAMVDWAVNVCNSANVRYSQDYRNQKTVNGITYYDCSSFVNYAVNAGGLETPNYAPTHNAFTTSTMGAELKRIGFKEYQVGSGFRWIQGDIGVNAGEHCEICYSGGTGSGVFMGAHTSNAPSDGQVSIGSSSNPAYRRSFDLCYRYEGDGGGISEYVVSAICGNFWTESNINPGVWESLSPGAWTDLKKGFGLGQWTNTGGDTHGRLYKLHEWLSSNGYADGSMEGQAAYIRVENVWNKSTDYQKEIEFNTLSEFLSSVSTDLNYLTKAWLFCWEGINNGTLEIRQSHAKQCLDYIAAHADDPNITTYISSNDYLTESQILSNAVMLYRIMGGGTPEPPEPEPPEPEPPEPEPPTPTRKKKGMPVWMMVRYR